MAKLGAELLKAAENPVIDRWAQPLGKAVLEAYQAAGPAGRTAKNFAHGVWLGHPLHPVLTDVPIGAWTAALALDLAGNGDAGMRRAARFAIAVGLVGAVRPRDERAGHAGAAGLRRQGAQRVNRGEGQGLRVRERTSSASAPSYTGKPFGSTKGDAVRRRPALAFAIVIALLFAAAAYAAEITGTWIGKTEVPGQGTDQVTMVLKKTNTGSYAGTVSDSLGQIAEGTEIKNVSWSDNVLVFSFALADGANVKLTLRLEEGKLNGNWVHEGGDSGSIVLEKK